MTTQMEQRIDYAFTCLSDPTQDTDYVCKAFDSLAWWPDEIGLDDEDEDC